MRFSFGIFVAVIFAASGLAKPALADPYADAVSGLSGTYDGAETDIPTAEGKVIGAPDQVFIQIADDSTITLQFLDNVALGDGNAATADLQIDTFDLLYPGAAIIRVSNDGVLFHTLPAPPINDPARLCLGDAGQNCNYDDHVDGFITMDVDSTGLGAVTHVQITDLPAAIDGEDEFPLLGFDLDAVVALDPFNLGTANIVKTLTEGGTDIDISTKSNPGAAQVYQFTITITNESGEDLSGILFKDVVPAEFDITLAEVSVDINNRCSVDAFEHTNSGKSGKTQLQPDIIEIEADALAIGESCTITVDVTTVPKPNGKHGLWTPTSCPSNNKITLNEGVQVIDTNGADDVLLFIDDDTIELDCVDP